MSKIIHTVYAGEPVSVDLMDEYGTRFFTAHIVPTANGEPVQLQEYVDGDQHWTVTSDGKIYDRSTGMVRQAFQVVNPPGLMELPESPTFRVDEHTRIVSVDEARKLAEKILPDVMTHEEASAEFRRISEFPEEEDRFGRSTFREFVAPKDTPWSGRTVEEEVTRMFKDKRREVVELMGVPEAALGTEPPPELLKSNTGAVPTYHHDSRVGVLQYPDGTEVKFLGNGHFACTCTVFRKTGGCCTHIEKAIVKGDDAQFIPYNLGQRTSVVLPMYWKSTPWMFAKVYLVPLPKRTAYVAMLHTYRIHKDTTSEACRLCDTEELTLENTWCSDFLVPSAVKLGTVRKGDGRMSLIYILSEQLKFAVKYELYDCEAKSHRSLPQARVNEKKAREFGLKSPEMLRWMWFCMTTAMCPFCWNAKMEAASMKFDSLDIK